MDAANVETLRFDVFGIAVSFHFDVAEKKPRDLASGWVYWIGEDVRLGAMAQQIARRAIAERLRLYLSAEALRERAKADDPCMEWLYAVDASYPGLSNRKLAEKAMEIAKMNGKTLKISRYKAEQYLTKKKRTNTRRTKAAET